MSFSDSLLYENLSYHIPTWMAADLVHSYEFLAVKYSVADNATLDSINAAFDGVADGMVPSVTVEESVVVPSAVFMSVVKNVELDTIVPLVTDLLSRDVDDSYRLKYAYVGSKTLLSYCHDKWGDRLSLFEGWPTWLASLMSTDNLVANARRDTWYLGLDDGLRDGDRLAEALLCLLGLISDQDYSLISCYIWLDFIGFDHRIDVWSELEGELDLSDFTNEYRTRLFYEDSILKFSPCLGEGNYHLPPHLLLNMDWYPNLLPKANAVPLDYDTRSYSGLAIHWFIGLFVRQGESGVVDQFARNKCLYLFERYFEMERGWTINDFMELMSELRYYQSGMEISRQIEMEEPSFWLDSEIQTVDRNLLRVDFSRHNYGYMWNYALETGLIDRAVYFVTPIYSLLGTLPARYSMILAVKYSDGRCLRLMTYSRTPASDVSFKLLVRVAVLRGNSSCSCEYGSNCLLDLGYTEFAGHVSVMDE